jgi:hypothetical protein
MVSILLVVYKNSSNVWPCSSAELVLPLGEIYLSIASINYVGLAIAVIAALIFNPFIRWYFSRHTWNAINTTCAIFFFIWIVFDVIFYIGELKFRKKVESTYRFLCTYRIK